MRECLWLRRCKGPREVDRKTMFSPAAAPRYLTARVVSPALSFLACGVISAAQGAELVETFDASPSSPLARKLMTRPHVSFEAQSGVGGSGAIRVWYEGYARGSKRVTATQSLARTETEATLVYDVKFCQGFDFAKGGKLHGLGPAQPVTGGQAVKPSQWSARVIFRSGGGVAAYLYHQELPGQYGEVISNQRFHFTPNRYYAVSLYIKLNDPGEKRNGMVRVYVDGVLIISKDSVRFRSFDDEPSRISNLLFNTFHGGHSEDFSPRNPDGSYSTECAYFDNFAVHPYLHVRRAPGT